MKERKISLFYKILPVFLLVLLGGFLAVRFALLRPWLVRYEASQPKHASQQIFADLFSPADWGRVHELAGLEGDREDFVRSMEEMTEGRGLSLVETSAGLSGDRRYIVKLEGENLAAFTLKTAPEGEEPTWRLGGVELLAKPEGERILIRTLEGQRVRVNGVELGEDCQIQTTRTAAEKYLPEGVAGRRTVLWETHAGWDKGAQVCVTDQNGAEIPVVYDGGCYVVEETAEEPTDGEREKLLGAAKTYARYMIRASDAAQLRRYFDSGSAIYRTICSSEIWIKTTSGHSFSDEEVREFRRYGEDMFSARVSMHMDVRRGNGSSKPYEVDSTFFFHRKDGAWRAFEMTNVDVQEEIVRTRLVFMDEERELGRMFVSSEDRSFVPPEVTVPQGRRFAGWAVRERRENQITMTVRFRPGEDGAVTLPAGYEPEPVTLYAAFE